MPEEELAKKPKSIKGTFTKEQKQEAWDLVKKVEEEIRRATNIIC